MSESHLIASRDNHLNDAVNRRVDDLLSQGALPINDSFNIAREGQGDMIYDGRRLLVTPNDDQFMRYTEVMDSADLPRITPDPVLSSSEVVVGEIPRDARTLPQIIRSRPAEGGITPADIFFKIGSRLSELARTRHMLPDPQTFSSKQLVVLRSQADVLLLPPVGFRPPAPDVRQGLVDVMSRDLDLKYQRFGAATLAEAFRKGLQHE